MPSPADTGVVTFAVGERVRAKFEAQRLGAGRTKYFPGMVTDVHPDGCCDIGYDDGDFEARVPVKFIKKAVSPAKVTKSEASRGADSAVEAAVTSPAAAAVDKAKAKSVSKANTASADGGVTVDARGETDAPAPAAESVPKLGDVRRETFEASREKLTEPQALRDAAASLADAISAATDTVSPSPAGAAAGTPLVPDPITAAGPTAALTTTRAPAPAPSPQAEAPAAAVAEYGRGARKIKPTVTMVDGFAVKRGNMYDMESGERSVWDVEMAANPDAEGLFTARDRRPATTAPTVRKPAGPRPAAPPSAEQLARQQKNEALRQSKAAALAKSGLVLQRYRAVFERFGAHLPAPGTEETAAAVEEDSTVEQPAELKVTMRDYQLRGLRWLLMMHDNGLNAILADEMGLGKTLQTIAFLAHLKFNRQEGGPHLVVAPLSVLSSWMSELNRFCPALRGVKLHSADEKERKRLIQALAASPEDFDVVVTTFEMAKSPQLLNSIGSRCWWRYLVIDEGHVLKNEASQISQALRKFHFAHALLLTGTPLQNNLHELWSILNFLHPSIFPPSTVTAFDSAFNLGAKSVQVDNEQLAAASMLLRPLMLRRTKDEVEKGMPPKLETTIQCPLSDMQLFWYKRLLLRESALLKQLEQEHADQASTGSDWKKLSSLLMQLRKCCNHPFLFPGVDPSGEEAYEKQLVDGSGKFQVLSRLLAKLFAAGHRVVLFSQFTSTLDLLEDFLNHKGYKYCRLDGSTNRVQRTVDINAFNMEGSKRFVFLMSTRAGGLGINCQTADTCILFDSDWNPQVDLQAMARVHRIGQKKVVHMYRLVAAGTVEERIVQRAEKKLYLDQMVNRGSTAKSEELDEVSVSEMMGMLKFGAQCCFNSTAPPTDVQLDAIIDRNRTSADSIDGISGGRQHSAASFDASAPLVKLRELNGEEYGDTADGADAKKKDDLRNLGGLLSGGKGGGTMADINEEWDRLQKNKREKKSRMETVHVAGVGKVNVLTENNYLMGEQMPNAANRGMSLRYKPEGRQVAGRDFAHEDTCLRCWKGADKPKPAAAATGARARATGIDGGLRACDLCPASYHLRCVGMAEEDATGWGTWACPHHQCDTCGRKAAAAGGLLFRCSVCPRAFCEDHLPPEALIMGECERFQALGFYHPKQGCYVQCSAKCKELSTKLGLASGDGSAAAIIGATGIDTTATLKRKAPSPTAAPAPARLKTDDRSSWERLEAGVAKALTKLLARPASTVGDASHGFKQRALGKETADSTLELLHDLIFETDLHNSAALKKRNAHSADGIAGERAALVDRILGWKGVAAERTPSAPKPAEREVVAERFLELVRELEGTRADTLVRVARLLGLQKVQTVSGGLRSKPVEGGVARKALASLISLFLTLPSGVALLLDQRQADASTTKKLREGDPGFIINAPPLKANGVKYSMQEGVLKPVLPPRPAHTGAASFSSKPWANVGAHVRQQCASTRVPSAASSSVPAVASAIRSNTAFGASDATYLASIHMPVVAYPSAQASNFGAKPMPTPGTAAPKFASKPKPGPDAASAAPAASALPPNWASRVSNISGNTFYVNTATGVTQWVRPTQ